jgi:3-oxoacyl-[acyl-carrier-protein] synthase-3
MDSWSSKTIISGIGTYVPARKLTNHELEAIVDTTDEWIVQRTGIRERRIASEQEFSSQLAVEAVQNMVQRYQVTLEDVEMILVATQTGDLSFPSVAAQVQDHFDIPSTGAVDLAATCAGFTYGIHLGQALIRSGTHRKVLVIGVDTLSKVTDYTDRTTCILFGDGAGAIMLEAAASTFDGRGVIATHTGTEGAGGKHVYRTGLSKHWKGLPLHDSGKVVQNGREVYRWATQTIPTAAQALLMQAHLSADSVRWFIPHSANLRMIQSICEKMDFPMERTLYSLEYYGNTSAASIPLALDLGIKHGQVHTRDILLLYGFGGGLTHSGVLVEWGL